MPPPRSAASSRPDLSPSDRARLARRYPQPLIPRLLLVGVVVAVAAVALGWLVWAGLAQSSPAVSAKVSAYTVVSDTEIAATVTVDRPDPSVPVVCRISAQAEDFQPVGEVNLKVDPSEHGVVDAPVSITTVRRATTATVRECSPT
ncbi:MAG: DUF4307 domain-containing protein [Microlunatus sp.]|nr:DUF4307 domain-containing protein [Microlunatus sp.]MDN5770869.1 DUF4307 domain-containing protein [Microlunatus sp.]MDN5805164.1 DUF4307 domain-containing protein [Microlunatus sp.]